MNFVSFSLIKKTIVQLFLANTIVIPYLAINTSEKSTKVEFIFANKGVEEIQSPRMSIDVTRGKPREQKNVPRYCNIICQYRWRPIEYTD